jgi:carboxyl-terminal processing protease
MQATELAEQGQLADTDFDLGVHLKAFDQIVETIDQSHWDLDLIESVFRPKAAELRATLESAESVAEYREIVEQLLGSLKQSHFGLIPAAAYSEMEARDRRGGSGFSGLTVRYVAPDFLVTDVRPDSPAFQAGVRCGWKLIATQTADRAEILEQAAEVVKTSTLRLETAAALVAQQLLGGPADQEIKATLEDLNGDSQEIGWVMGPPVGQASKFGNLPEVAVEFRAQRLPENIGYLSFNAFLDAPRVMREFTKAIETFRDAEGLVIDLRGNMGGLMVLTMGMCGWFVEEPVDLGKMQMRGTALNLKLNPRSPRYEKPVAVLIDAVSISAAEVMAGGMQDAGTARLFGQRTAGLVLPSNVVRLANGDGLQYAMSDYHSLSGRTLEIEGVKPDVEVPLDQTVLSRGVDPVLEAAVQWIIATGRK